MVDAALAGGVDTVLVREKQMDSARLLAFASNLRQLTRNHGARLIIHTQADVARAIGADGVHLSSLEMNQIPDIRAWMEGESKIFSTSCHNAIELQFAEQFGADFAFLSPVFATGSHPDQPPLGIDKFREMASASSLPVVALGGIDTSNRASLSDYPVAAISAILDADDPQNAAAALSQTG